jgi:hypothetical protein
MELYLITIIIILGTLCGFVYIYHKSNKYDLEFMNEEQTKAFLLKDDDNYVKNMTKYDLIARKSNRDLYLSRISKCASFFTSLEKEKLIECTREADQFLENFEWKNILNCNIISKLPWKFSLTRRYDNFEYEEGLPHTRKDVIFLSTNVMNMNKQDLVNILIHEKIHIFQRINQNQMKIIVNQMGFVVSENISENLLKLKRSNPDISDKIFSDKTSSRIYLCTYASESPKGINDANSSMVFEHPYEKMAYEIAGEYTRQMMNKYI